jgi:hypothetical protein
MAAPRAHRDACRNTERSAALVTRFRRGVVWFVVALLVLTLVATLLVDATA